MSINSILLSSKERIRLLEDLEARFEFGDDPQSIADDFIQYGNSVESEIGEDISHAISHGYSFAEGIEKWMPNVALEAIRIGSESDDLSHGCKNAKESIIATSESLLKLAISIGQPFALLIAVFIVMSLSITNIMDQFIQTTPMNQWPLVSRSVYEFGYHLNSHYSLYMMIIIVGILGTYLILTRWIGSNRVYFSSFPIFKQYNQVNAIQILNGIAQLRKVGVSLDEALEVLLISTNYYSGYHLSLMQERIQRSLDEGQLGKLLDTGLLDERVISRLRRVTNPAISDIKLLERAAKETKESYQRQLELLTAFLTYLTRVIALGMFLWTMAGCVMIALPDISL